MMRRANSALMNATTIQERFEKFDRDHPGVYCFFRRFAQELRAAGRKRCGAKLIIERIRWHYAITSAPSASGEEFKIDNRFTSRYARKLIAERPEFADFFELRKLLTP